MTGGTKRLMERPGGAWHPVMWAVIAAILLLPLVAMQFTDEVNWTAFDFAAAGVLLVGAGLVWEVATRLVSERPRRLVIAAVLVLVVALLWAQGAVGIF